MDLTQNMIQIKTILSYYNVYDYGNALFLSEPNEKGIFDFT